MDNHFLKGDLLTIDQIKEIKETFRILSVKTEDEQNPFVLPTSELKLAMMGLGLSPTNDEIERILNQLKLFKKINQENELPFLSYNDFYEIVYFRLANKPYETDCKKTFNLISGGKEEIKKNDIELLSQHFHEKLKDDYISKLFATADCDDDGKISHNDFISLLKHTNYI